MEPQINISCCNRRRNGGCKLLVLAILITLFAFTIGLIIGAALAETFLAALPAIIVLAVVLLILIIIKIVLILCERRN